MGNGAANKVTEGVSGAVHRVKKSALLEVPVELAYKVVADVTRYPEFLPGCDAVEVKKQTETGIEARVDVSGAGLSQSFVTKNTYNASIITMALKEGPFKSLSGEWHFVSIGDVGCRVDVEIDYELEGALAKILGGMADKIANKVVDAFSARIDQAASGTVY